MHKRCLFVTGSPDIGKTTLLASVLRPLALHVGGYTVKDHWSYGRRCGLDMVDLLSRQSRPLAVMRGGVMVPSLDTFETFGVQAVQNSQRLCLLSVLDELGRFELRCPKFMRSVFELLGSRRFVLGVLKNERNPFLDQVRSHQNVQVLFMTRANRQTTAQAVWDWVDAIDLQKKAEECHGQTV